MISQEKRAVSIWFYWCSIMDISLIIDSEVFGIIYEMNIARDKEKQE